MQKGDIIANASPVSASGRISICRVQPWVVARAGAPVDLVKPVLIVELGMASPTRGAMFFGFVYTPLLVLFPYLKNYVFYNDCVRSKQSS